LESKKSTLERLITIYERLIRRDNNSTFYSLSIGGSPSANWACFLMSIISEINLFLYWDFSSNIVTLFQSKSWSSCNRCSFIILRVDVFYRIFSYSPWFLTSCLHVAYTSVVYTSVPHNLRRNFYTKYYKHSTSCHAIRSLCPNEFSQFIVYIINIPSYDRYSIYFLSNATNKRNSESRRLHYINVIIINNTLPIINHNNVLQTVTNIRKYQVQ